MTMDLQSFIDDLHRSDVRHRLWMPRIFDETFSWPGWLWLGHVPGTNCSEYRCMECGLWVHVREDKTVRACSHVASDPDYDG